MTDTIFCTHRLLRARTSRTFSPTSAPVVVPLLPPLPVVLPLPAVPLRRPRRRPRRRVRATLHPQKPIAMEKLTIPAEKEESDDDMGFGLFD